MGKYSLVHSCEGILFNTERKGTTKPYKEMGSETSTLYLGESSLK